MATSEDNYFPLAIPQRPNSIGKVYVCGKGETGQLGLGYGNAKRVYRTLTEIKDIKNGVDVSAGSMHSIVLTSDGNVYTFGCNDEGALGRITTNEEDNYLPKQVILPGKVIKITAGELHSACLLEDGRVFAWGSFQDFNGVLSLLTQENRRLPCELLAKTKCHDIASGANHLVLLDTKGKVYTMGSARNGVLGRISERLVEAEGRRSKASLLKPLPIVLKGCKPFINIWATNCGTFVCESATKNIYACGMNNFKQLALAASTTDSLTEFWPLLTLCKDVKSIVGGTYHTIVLKTDGSINVIGCHLYGRLGLSATLHEDVQDLESIHLASKVTSVAAGDQASFALTEDNQFYVWGNNLCYQLGLGNAHNQYEPTPIDTKETENKIFLKVASGSNHTLLLMADKDDDHDEEKL